MRTVMVFGVFDGLHEGHRKFLEQARALGDELIVVLTPDHIVSEFKKRSPKFSFSERKKALESEHLATQVLEGDAQTGSWEVIKNHTPNIIALGYDQRELGNALRALIPTLPLKLAIIVLGSHNPEHYKSSLLN